MVGRSERKTSAEDNSPADPLRRGLLGGCLAGFEGAFFGGSLGALLGLWLWGRDFADPLSGFFLLAVLVAAGAVLGPGLVGGFQEPGGVPLCRAMRIGERIPPKSEVVVCL